MNVSRVSAVAGACVASLAMANDIAILDGQTSVVLNFEALESLASLALSGVSDDVIPAGTLDGSVAFPINARDGDLPTTFGFEAGNFLGSFSGTIEHTGSVFFNDNTVEVGDFTIGFDGERAVDSKSGFFVESTAGIAAILFDVGAPSFLTAGGNGVVLEAPLLVSPEFGGFLFDNGLSQSNLAGAEIGLALVEGGSGCTGVDVTDNRRTNVVDLLFFASQYVTGNPAADYNGDASLDVMDIMTYLDDFIDCRWLRRGQRH